MRPRLRAALLALACWAATGAGAQGTGAPSEARPSLNDRRLGVIKAQTAPSAAAPPASGASAASSPRTAPLLAPATGRSLQDARRNGAQGAPVLLPSAATTAAAAASAASAARP